MARCHARSHLDIYAARYAQKTGHRANNEGRPDALFRGAGDGTFALMADCPATRGLGFSTAVAVDDFTGDGFVDVFVAQSIKDELFTTQFRGQRAFMTLSQTLKASSQTNDNLYGLGTQGHHQSLGDVNNGEYQVLSEQSTAGTAT